MTQEELVTLMESCPVSCRTNCESFSYEPSASPIAPLSSSPSVSIKEITGRVSFYIQNVPGPLPPDTQTSLENGMFLHFNEYINDADRSSSTQLKYVEVQTQEELRERVGNGRRHLRREKQYTLSSAGAKALDESIATGWLQTRNLAGDKTLQVNITAEAESRVLSGSMLSALLSKSMNASDASKIFEGDTFFEDATISFTRQTQTVEPDFIEGTGSGGAGQRDGNATGGAPTTAIVLSSIGVVMVAGAATGYAFKRRRETMGGGPPGGQTGAFLTFSPKSFGVISDEDDHHGNRPYLPGHLDTGGDLKMQGSIFSYEESPCNRNAAGGAAMALSALLGSRSRSRDSTGSCSSQEGEGQIGGMNNGPGSIPEKMDYDQPDPMSPEGSVVAIPPMIVIDNIDMDDDEGESSGDEHDQRRQTSVTPRIQKTDHNLVHRIEASSTLAKALASNTVRLSEVMTCTVESNKGEASGKREVPPQRSPISLRMDDSESVASTPVMTMTKGDATTLPLRRALSSGDLSISSLSRSDPAHALNQLLQKNFSNLGDTNKGSSDESSTGDVRLGPNGCVLGNPFNHEEGSQSASEASFLFQPQEIVSPPSTTRSSPRTNDDFGYNEQMFEGLEQVSTSSAPARDKSTSPSNRKLREIFTSKMRKGLLKQRKDEDSSSNVLEVEDNTVASVEKADINMTQQLAHTESLPSSPSGRGESLQSTYKEEESITQQQQAGLFSSFRPWSKKTSSPMTAEETYATNGGSGRIKKSPLLDSLHRRIQSDDGASPATNGGEYQYTFAAPSIGKLGIIIHKTMVHAVKDYSPLFGKLEPGDRIVRIDDDSTLDMTTSEVTQLLARKRSGKGPKKGTIHITIVSQRRKARFKCDARNQAPRDELEDSLVVSRSVDPLLMEELRGVQDYSPTFLQAESSFSREQSPQHPSPNRKQKQTADAQPRSAEGQSEQEDTGSHGFHLLGAIMSSDDEDDGFHIMNREEQDMIY